MTIAGKQSASKGAAKGIDDVSTKKRVIHLDGLVLLKIVKHAHESPETTGILLGLDTQETLEITNCFPLLAETANERRQDMYVKEMLKLLREVRIDNYNIGWYQSCPLNSFATESFVQIQHRFQEEMAGAAAIVYDPTSASLGSLYLKAFRLSDKFMKFMAQKANGMLTSKAVAEFKITHTNILEEIPVMVSNGEYTKALLCELAKGERGSASFEKLDLSVNPYLEKHVESLQEELDDMIGEMASLHDYLKDAQLNKQKRMKWIQERKAENRERKKSGLEPLPEDASKLDLKEKAEPSRLSALLETTQISSYCEQINSYMANSKIKLDVARTFQDTN